MNHRSEMKVHSTPATNATDALLMVNEFRRLATKLHWLGRAEEATRLEAVW